MDQTTHRKYDIFCFRMCCSIHPHSIILCILYNYIYIYIWDVAMIDEAIDLFG